MKRAPFACARRLIRPGSGRLSLMLRNTEHLLTKEVYGLFNNTRVSSYKSRMVFTDRYLSICGVTVFTVNGIHNLVNSFQR